MSIANILSRDVVFIGNVPMPPRDKPVPPCIGAVLSLSVEAQLEDNWCWAKVAGGIASAYKDPDPDNWMPCSVARRVLQAERCCPEGCCAECDDTQQELDAALDGHLDPTPIHQQIDKTFGLVQNSIDNGIPIAVRVVLPNASAHFVVISGYCVREDGSQHVFVCDSQDGGRRQEDFAGFLSGLGGKPKWDKTYLTQGIQGQGLLKVPKET